MSAAATAAGYLYASGRLRGKRDASAESERRPEKRAAAHGARRPLRVAALPEPEPMLEPKPATPKRVPRIEYRTRRWRPDGG